jgi:DNA-binding MarR family transcriptional regulator
VSVLATRTSCTSGGGVESDLLEYRAMQMRSENDPAGVLSRIVAENLPSRRGLEAWQSLLRAHATLIRRLELDLAETTGLALADFDVLGQLALAGGELRMTALANRALISRSGMTRRVNRLVDQGLVARSNVDGDARGVVVALTDAGVTRLAETAPVHVRGVAELFVSRLDEQELTALKSCLDKVIVDCEFG